MRTFYCSGFTGVQPTNTAAIVVAINRASARSLLDKELKRKGLPGLRLKDNIIELNPSKTQVLVLCDGDY